MKCSPLSTPFSLRKGENEFLGLLFSHEIFFLIFIRRESLIRKDDVGSLSSWSTDCAAAVGCINREGSGCLQVTKACAVSIRVPPGKSIHLCRYSVAIFLEPSLRCSWCFFGLQSCAACKKEERKTKKKQKRKDNSLPPPPRPKKRGCKKTLLVFEEF